MHRRLEGSLCHHRTEDLNSRGLTQMADKTRGTSRRKDTTTSALPQIVRPLVGDRLQ